jgi:hypothetical protein
MLTNDNLISGTITCFKAGVFEAIDLLPKQIQALKALTDTETDEILYGGAAGGGKTWLGCEWMLWNCLAYPGTRWAIGRHHLKQIRESTVVTFRKVCKKHGIPPEWWKYNEQSVHITFSNGSELIGVEMMHRPGDPEFDGFGSTEYTGGWIEEGGGVAAKAREVLGTRVGRHRNDEYGIGGKLLVTGNPSRNWMYREFFKPAKTGQLPAQKKFIQSFAHENEKRESGYLERLEKLTGQTRQRLLLGNWDFEGDPDQIIDTTAISDIFENIHVIRDESKKCIVADVALHGSDLYRAAVFYGDVLVDHIEMAKSGGADVLNRIQELRIKHGVRASGIIYDSDGVGGFIGGKGGFIPGAVPFHANAAQVKTDKDKGRTFAHLKDQCGFLIADDINEGRVYAEGVKQPEHVEMLSEELAAIKRMDTGDGPMRLRPKSEVKEALGRSPDFSDLFLMKKYYDLIQISKSKQGAYSVFTS